MINDYITLFFSCQYIFSIFLDFYILGYKERGARNVLLFQRQIKLLVFALSSGFRLLLTLNTRLFVVFSLAKFGEDAGTSALTFKATKGTVQGLAFLNSNFCHYLFPPSACYGFPQQYSFFIIQQNPSLVNTKERILLYIFYFYFTTIFTILLGTEISLTIVLPSR